MRKRCADTEHTWSKVGFAQLCTRCYAMRTWCADCRAFQLVDAPLSAHTSVED